MLIKGRLFDLISILIIFSIYYYTSWEIRRGKVPYIRRLPAIDHIDEAVGRSIEMGRPVHFSPGWGFGTIYQQDAPQLIAGLGVLPYLADMTARLGVRLITTYAAPGLIPMVTQILRDAYMGAGKIEDYRPDMVRYISSNQIAFMSGVIGMISREKPGANILIGGYCAESLQFIEAGHTHGGIQIGGTANFHNVAYFLAAADYALIGEEIFAVAAYLTKDPSRIGSLRVQDNIRVITIILVIGVALFATFQSAFLLNLLVM